MNLYNELEKRGLVKQVTDASLATALQNSKLTLYAGFDPTADSLHVGHMLPIITLRRFQMAGHRPIAVIGGATGMIGDPSGKSAERNLLTPEQIESNVQGQKRIFEKFIDFSGPQSALLTNNAHWFGSISAIDYLRLIGKHFTVNHMLTKDSVRGRLEDREHGISYTEFSYMLLQAYDFYFLNRKENCSLQIGGSDQWGNITAGCELIRRMAAQEGRDAPQVYGLTMPLVMKADGTKFGKTETGTVWLTADKTSPYQFYQFFLRTADADVLTYLNYFTFLSLERISELEASLKTSPEKREAQNALAETMTEMVHGKDEVRKAQLASKALFGSEIKSLDRNQLLDVLADAPSTKKSQSSLESGLSLVDLLVETSLCASKGAARKDLVAGGIYVNNDRINDANAMIQREALIAGAFVVLRKGKKNYHLIAFE